MLIRTLLGAALNIFAIFLWWGGVNEHACFLAMRRRRRRRRAVRLFFDLERDRLPGRLQEVDGLAQRFALQTDPVDGQHTVPDVNGPRPAELGEREREETPETEIEPTRPNTRRRADRAAASRHRKTRTEIAAI